MSAGLYTAEDWARFFEIHAEHGGNVTVDAAQALKIAAFLRASVVAEEPEWEWGSEGKEGTSDPDPRPLEDDRPYWPEHLTGVRELTREQAESVIAAWNKGDPESSFLIRRRKAGPWVPVS